MNSFRRFALAAVATAALLRISIVDGAAYYSPIVVCLSNNESICVGNSYFTSPSPASMCEDPDDPTTCNTVYVGGWTWEYHFIKGGYFDEGTDLSLEDINDVSAAENGLVVSVSLQDDESTCSIKIGNQTCSKCSASNCTTASSVTYDCSNIDMGRSSKDDECEDLEPIFYPLIIETTLNNTNGGTESSSSSNMVIAENAATTAAAEIDDDGSGSSSAMVIVPSFKILLTALVVLAGSGLVLAL